MNAKWELFDSKSNTAIDISDRGKRKASDN
jgi:hypothetical protein